MRRRVLLNRANGSSSEDGTGFTGAVLFASNNGTQLSVINGQENWPDSGWTPIAIEVVPRAHDRYGDGSGGFMSLVCMDYNNPVTGVSVASASQTDDSVNNAMYWGVPDEGAGNNIFNSSTAIINNQGGDFIPYQTDSNSTDCSIYQGNVIWPYSGTATKLKNSPSTEYDNDGSYVQATTGKSLCDFNGIRNTAALYVKTRTTSQWTSSSVSNTNDSTSTPAAACAGRFKTVGTNSFLDVFSGITSNDLSYGTPTSTKNNKGFWYLPALGELCYIPSKKYEINKVILALNQKYGNVGTLIDTTHGYWSSSQYSNIGTWYAYLNVGNMSFYGRSRASYPVRAFLRF